MEENDMDINDINQTLLDKLFDPKPYLEKFEREMNGEALKNNEWVKVRRSLAGSDFISISVMNLNAIINSNNLMGDFSEEEYYSILVENVLIFLTAALNEPTIDSKNYMQIYLLYSNPMEMFAKLVIGGHATETVKQILTQTYNENGLVREKQGKFNLMEVN